MHLLWEQVYGSSNLLALIKVIIIKKIKFRVQRNMIDLLYYADIIILENETITTKNNVCSSVSMEKTIKIVNKIIKDIYCGLSI